ncbi:purine catabolism regulator [Microbacterium resistens]|uniref:Purine catabolism regulator n=1 Tax=Microbacterium resistens TaxID=156977 RepID=A0ABU1SES3_9MICO|nr:PucR family transcriptional regulator [Microbacterium resistens]MDR6868106.1 purine catabolism regulator [Microbacterium resistens]
MDHPAPTLRTLLGRDDLGLRLVPADAAPGDTIDRPVRWVHSSDLADPTPFLAEDLVLLTTGTQFSEDDPALVSAYVARLATRGVLALGFGTDVHRAGVPDELISACAAQGIALFEVPYDTPFIAIARAHAEAIAAQAYARRTWALETQRALAIAALRPRGLESTLTELARRLDCWVGMYDAAGAPAHGGPADPEDGLPGPGDRDIVAAAVDLLARGGSASRAIEAAGRPYTLFTLGRTGHLRGVIAIAAGALDPESRAVVTSVIAMAGLSLEQSDQLARSRRRLHSQLLASLRADEPSLARRVLGSLPAAPVVVAIAVGQRENTATEWWERRREAGAAVFLAESPDGLVICLPAADTGALDEAAEQTGVRIGVSEPEDYSAFSRAHAQALIALRRGGRAGRGAGGADGAAEARGVIRYADAAESSVLGALATDEARLVAESRLAPLRRHDGEGDGDLERSLRVWLEHDARLEPAAEALGIHRHTLRSRIAQAAALLRTDLASFPARAELWAALQTVRD